jgi:hypothetical protein
MRQDSRSGRAKASAGPAPSYGEVVALHMFIDELRNERDHWREMAVSLQTLALPAPRRSLWPFRKPAVCFRVGSARSGRLAGRYT